MVRLLHEVNIVRLGCIERDDLQPRQQPHYRRGFTWRRSKPYAIGSNYSVIWREAQRQSPRRNGLGSHSVGADPKRLPQGNPRVARDDAIGCQHGAGRCWLAEMRDCGPHQSDQCVYVPAFCGNQQACLECDKLSVVNLRAPHSALSGSVLSGDNEARKRDQGDEH
jgi:hypothetical protein